MIVTSGLYHHRHLPTSGLYYHRHLPACGSCAICNKQERFSILACFTNELPLDMYTAWLTSSRAITDVTDADIGIVNYIFSVCDDCAVKLGKKYKMSIFDDIKL